MKKIKEIKSSKRKENAAREKTSIGPEEYEEQISMDIRMKEQPLQSSAKAKKKENQK